MNLELSMQRQGLKLYKVYINDGLSFSIFTYFTAGKVWSPVRLNWKKC